MADLSVLEQDAVLMVKGHMEDTTDFAPFHAELAKRLPLDLSGLHSLSFVGLQNFVTCLRGLGGPFRFKCVPADVYRLLLLFVADDQALTVDSAQVDVYAVARGGPARQELLPMAELATLGSAGGAFARWRGELVGASLAVLCRGARQAGGLPEPRFASPWTEAHADACLFWLDYCAYSQVVVEACALNQRASLILVMEMLHRIIKRIKVHYKTFKDVFGDDTGGYDGDAMKTLVNSMLEFTEQNYAKVRGEAGKLAALQAELIRRFTAPDAAAADVYTVVGDLASAISALAQMTMAIDDAGKDIGVSIASLAYVFAWEGRFMTALADGSDEDALKLRRKFKFATDRPYSRDETRAEIAATFGDLGGEFSRITVTLQQFDLIKQVFDHRIREMAVASGHLAALAGDRGDWRDVQAIVLGLAGEKLVTDVEKLAFRFFFGEHAAAHAATGPRMASGEMVLF